MGTPSSRPRSGCCGLLCSAALLGSKAAARHCRERGREESRDSNLPHRRTCSLRTNPQLRSVCIAADPRVAYNVVSSSYRAS